MLFGKSAQQRDGSNDLAKNSVSGLAAPSLWASVLFALMVAFFFNGAIAGADQINENLPGYGEEGEADNYYLGPGDLLDIRVFGEPEVSSQVIVRIDGRISLPLAGELMAAGTTPENLSNNIRERLERYIESPSVTVMLVDSRSKTYYIIGQIQSPGEYHIDRSISVLQAIARAGGFLEWAKKDRIMIVGEKGASDKITYFDYDQFLRRGDSRRNVPISPGDTIVIP